MPDDSRSRNESPAARGSPGEALSPATSGSPAREVAPARARRQAGPGRPAPARPAPFPLALGAALLLAAVVAGLPWALSLAGLGFQPGAPAVAPLEPGLALAVEGDTAPAVYEEGGPPIAVNTAEEARRFLGQFAPELARAGAAILRERAPRQGFRAERVALGQLLLTREGHLVARYDVYGPGTTRRPAWIRFIRKDGRWQPLQVVIGEPR